MICLWDNWWWLKKSYKVLRPFRLLFSKTRAEKWYLMPREKVYNKETRKKLTAKINVDYIDPNWKEVGFNSAKEFYVSYYEDYIWANLYIIVPWIVLFIIIFLFLIIWFKRKRKCPSCKKSIKKDMRICPYCWEKVKK